MNLSTSEGHQCQCDFCGDHFQKVIVVEGPHVQVQFCSRCALMIGGAGLASFNTLQKGGETDERAR